MIFCVAYKSGRPQADADEQATPQARRTISFMKYIHKKLKFGKHKNQEIATIPSNYLFWLLDYTGIDEDMRSTIKAELYARVVKSRSQALPAR